MSSRRDCPTVNFHSQSPPNVWAMSSGLDTLLQVHTQHVGSMPRPPGLFRRFFINLTHQSIVAWRLTLPFPRERDWEEVQVEANPRLCSVAFHYPAGKHPMQGRIPGEGRPFKSSVIYRISSREKGRESNAEYPFSTNFPAVQILHWHMFASAKVNPQGVPALGDFLAYLCNWSNVRHVSFKFYMLTIPVQVIIICIKCKWYVAGVISVQFTSKSDWPQTKWDS